MATITYLRPTIGQHEAERLLAEVEASVAEGRELGDRRGALCDLVAALQADQTRLLDAMEDLRAVPPLEDPALGVQLKRLDEHCSGLYVNVSLMIRRANELSVGQG